MKLDLRKFSWTRCHLAILVLILLCMFFNFKKVECGHVVSVLPSSKNFTSSPFTKEVSVTQPLRTSKITYSKSVISKVQAKSSPSQNTASTTSPFHKKKTNKNNRGNKNQIKNSNDNRSKPTKITKITDYNNFDLTSLLTSKRQQIQTDPWTNVSPFKTTSRKGRAADFLSDNSEDEELEGSGEDNFVAIKDTWSASLTTLPNVSPTSKIQAANASTTLSAASETILVPVETNTEGVFLTAPTTEATAAKTEANMGTSQLTADYPTSSATTSTISPRTRKQTTSTTNSELAITWSTTGLDPLKISASVAASPGTLSPTELRTETETEYQTATTTPLPTTAIMKLGKPLNLTITEKGPTFIKVRWKNPTGAKGVISYIPSIAEDIGSCIESNARDFITRREYKFENLKPFTKYKLCVIAVYRGEYSEAAFIEAITSETFPSKPTAVKITNFSTSHVDLGWKEPANPNGKILGYIIQWSETNDKNNKTVVTNVTAVHIDPLKSNTSYTFCVLAETSAGQGQEDCIIANTAVDPLPTLPQNVRINFEEKGVFVRWDFKDHDFLPRDCIVNLTSDQIDWEMQNVRDCRSPVYFTNVSPHTKYCITVVASYSIGSKHIYTGCFQTPSSSPSKVRNFRANCGVTEVILSWENPERINGLLSGFLLWIHDNNKMMAKNMHFDEHAGFEKQHSLTLSPATHYMFEIFAETKNVTKKGEVATVECSTTAGVPHFPTGVPLVTTAYDNVDGESQVAITFNRDLFSSEQGEIVHYDIIISDISRKEPRRNGSSTMRHNVTWTQVKSCSVVAPYATSPEAFNPFSEWKSGMDCERDDSSNNVTCIIGCDNDCIIQANDTKRCNGPLRSGTSYSVKIRGYTAAGFSETCNVYFITESHVVVKVVIPTFTVILIAICAIASAIYLKRNRISILSLMKRPRIEVQPPQPLQMVHSIPVNKTTRPVNLSEFKQHFQVMWCDSTLKFSQEFEELQGMSPILSTAAALLPENRNKNRWVNILPFDHSRVKLLPLADDITSDYINATYIPGYNSKREYIATQGPLPSTKDDFWRMVWEQSSAMIIMVTQCVERGKVKCEIYWPEDREMHYYGDMAIQMRSESILTNYTIRIFDIQLGSRQSEVKQMHFTMWPDFGCPENTEVLLDFVGDVRHHMPHEMTGPIIVHCSAGVGRTGTFIAIDRLIQHVNNHDYVDVYGTVLEMRQHRSNMVQTEDQYIYIHESIKDHLERKELQNNKDKDGGSMKSSNGDSVISSTTILHSQDSQF